MRRQEIKDRVMNIVRQKAREKGIHETEGVLDQVPEMVSCVEMDKELIRSKIEAEFNKANGNPINKLLGLMGFQLVRRREAESYFAAEQSGEAVNVEVNHAGAEIGMLKINEEKLEQAAERMVDALSKVEQKQRQDAKDSSSNYSKVFKALDKSTQECAQLRTDMKAMKQSVIEAVQYMLFTIGSDAQNDAIGQQLIEMLEDMGASVYWSAEGAPFSQNTMFNVIKCENPEARRSKPCIAGADEVLVKGIQFKAIDTE